MDDLYRRAISLASTPASKWPTLALLTADAFLCTLIIWKIPYTEIDWIAYMQQVEQYLDGERDYTLIKGLTGPLVYPAAHVYIYSGLYRLTDGGKDIRKAQIIFAGLYLGVLSLVMASYRRAKAPLYIFPLLVISKRLHSIFLLRLFNDCFAVGALFLAIYAYQRRIWAVGSVAYSWAVATKMSILLAGPAIGSILLLALPMRRALKALLLMAQVQFILSVPFAKANAYGYIGRAFEFTRRFLFKWTVNWRFVGEETFLSREFSLALAVANISLLIFFLDTRWIRPSGMHLSDFISTVGSTAMSTVLSTAFKPLPTDVQEQISRRVTPSFILTTALSSLSIGMLCARSLHYQFYAYIAWSTPFLLWKSGMHPVLIYIVWASQEWSWNVYPSTPASSLVVVLCLVVQVFGAWWGTRNEFSGVSTSGVKQSNEQNLTR